MWAPNVFGVLNETFLANRFLILVISFRTNLPPPITLKSFVDLFLCWLKIIYTKKGFTFFVTFPFSFLFQDNLHGDNALLLSEIMFRSGGRENRSKCTKEICLLIFDSTSILVYTFFSPQAYQRPNKFNRLVTFLSIPILFSAGFCSGWSGSVVSLPIL